MPTLKQMQYFIAVVNEGSFSKASRKLHIAQPALSTSISNLEEELGETLLIRHSLGVRPTVSGGKLTIMATNIVKSFDDIQSQFKSFKHNPSGNVKIAIPTSLTSALTTPIIDNFKNMFPDVSVTIIEGMTGHIQHWLNDNEVDIAIMFSDKGESNPRSEVIGDENLSLVGKSSLLKGIGNEIAFSRCLDFPLITVTNSHAIRKCIDNKALVLGKSVNIACEIDSFYQLKNFVSRGIGVTIVPRSTQHIDWMSDDLRFINICGKDAVINICIDSSAEFENRNISKKLTVACKEIVSKVISENIVANC